jgi:hypothetical protein
MLLRSSVCGIPDGPVLEVDPDQRELIVGAVFAFRNPDGRIWVGRVDERGAGPPSPKDPTIIGRVVSTVTLH